MINNNAKQNKTGRSYKNLIMVVIRTNNNKMIRDKTKKKEILEFVN